MSELGETLKNARLQQGISIDELEEMTKIRKRYLEAIEAQDFDILPGNFYVRAFIKNYAEAVGLNPDELLDLYKNVIPARSTSPSIDTLSRKGRAHIQVSAERWSKWISGTLMVCFLLLIVVLIYFYFYHSESPQDQVLDETPMTNRTEGMSEKGLDSGSNVDAGTEESPSFEEETDTPPEPQDEPEPEPEVTFVNSDGTTDIYTVTGVEQLEVQVEIVGDRCWVWVREENRNGTEMYQGTMENEAITTWENEGSIWLRLGRANAASVTINGVQLEAFEGPNVRDLQINFVDAAGEELDAGQTE